MTRLPAGLLAALALLPAAALADTSCVIFPDSPKPVSVIGKQGVQSAPVRLAPCRDARIRGGAALACFTGAGGSRDCVPLADGARVDAQALGVAQREFEDWSFADLVAMLRGDQKVRFGLSRGVDDESPLPSSKVLDAASLAQWPLRDIDLAFPLTLELREAGADQPLLVVQVADAAAARIDTTLLAAGTDYNWRVRGADGEREGYFTLVDADTRAAVAQDVAHIESDAKLTPLARRLLVAELLGEQGFLLEGVQRLAAP